MINIQTKEGYELRYAKETDMMCIEAVDGLTERIPVVPLNGWRARNLAEYLLNDRTDKWQLGDAMVVPARVLQELPGWDGKNTDYLEDFGNELVSFEVVAVDPSYAKYIAVKAL